MIKTRRPLFWLAVALILGIVTGSYLIKGLIIAWIIFILLPFIIYYLIDCKLFFLLMIFFILGIGLIGREEYRYHSRYSINNYNQGEGLIIEGEVVEKLATLSGNKIYLDPENVNGHQVRSGLIELDKRFIGHKLENGQEIRAKLSLKTPPPALNPGQFSYKLYLKRKGVYSLGYLQEEPLIIKNSNSYFKSFVIACKEKLITNIDHSLSYPRREIIKAIILGEREHVPDHWQQMFSRAGASHLLAISGLHVGFITLIMIGLLQLIGLTDYPGKIIITLIMGFYIIITGGRSSVIRAGLFAILFLWAPIFKRRGDILNISGLTMIINLFVNPYALFNIGFQLTYLVLFIIILWAGRLKKLVSLIPSVSIAAQLGSFPISAYYFNLLTPVGIITNIWAIPLAAVIVLFSVIALILSLLHPVFLQVVSPVLDLLLSVLYQGMRIMENIPLGWLETASPEPVTVYFFYLLLLIMPYFIHQRYICENKEEKYRYWQIYLSLLMVLMTVIFRPVIKKPELEMVFLAVGQGDSIFIQLPDRKTLLVDGGGSAGRESDQAEQVILPFLQDRGIKKLDMVMVTHFDGDHARGIITVLKRRKVAALFLPAVYKENQLSARIMSLASENKIPVYSVSRGDYINNGEVEIHFLHPDSANYPKNNNYNSLVMKLDYRDFSLLLTGDLEKMGEYELTGYYDLNSEVLKLGHHGSDTSTTETFLEQVQPVDAVVSVGPNNYGHPSPAVLKRVEERDIDIWRTDEEGAIIITSDGGTHKIEGYLKNKLASP